MTGIAKSSVKPSELLAKIDRFADARVLCVGDVMLDRFVYGQVERISPEAPIPVLHQQSEATMLGGAGNVVRNIVGLGAECTFISIVGQDEPGRQILSLTGNIEQVTPYLIVDKERTSTEKTRYVAGSQQLLRVDRETPMPLDQTMSDKILAAVAEEIEDYPLLVLSDYGKGLLHPALVIQLIAMAAEKNIPVLVDPKSRNFAQYAGATLVTPNMYELSLATGITCRDEESAADAAKILLGYERIDYLLVTMGSRGMLLASKDADPVHISAQKREVFDVSGAGDTVMATLAVALGSGCTMQEAAFLANEAGGIVVGKMGTAVCYRTDLKTALHTHGARSGSRKLYPQDIAAEQCAVWQREGHKVGFTNGCFDIVHAGHISILNAAKEHCDKLVLAINSDDSVKRLKGETRPVNSEMDRAMLLAELEAVDMVVIFREDTPEAVLKKIRPDVLMKGADYEKHQIVGAEFVESYGGSVVRLPLKDGYSTTGTIEKLKKNAAQS